MSFRKHINFTNFVIVLCIFFIAILLIITVPILINWICNHDSVTEVPSNIASTSTTLIVVLISTITLLITKRQTDESLNQTKETIDDNKKFNTDSLEKTETMIKDNRKYNEKTLQLTNETINQSEEIMYIQLRFDSTEKSLFQFKNKLTDAHIIYNELIAVTSEDNFFNPRGYIIAQYTNWLFDLKLLEQLPQGLIYKLDAEFDKIGNVFPVLDFEKYLSTINYFSKADAEKCKRELNLNEIPKYFKFVDSLPYTENGKYDFRLLEQEGMEYVKNHAFGEIKSLQALHAEIKDK